jgi:hypothetical protein
MKKLIVGWRERIFLPDLLNEPVKCKVDTGAASSSIHARVLEIFEQASEDQSHQTMVRFLLFPDSSPVIGISQVAPLLEFRRIRSSNGHISRRPVIITTALLHEIRWPIEVTLADRQRMGFSMLLGREALRGRFVVDPQKSFWSPKQKKP